MLYRFSNTGASRFDVVRPDVDIVAVNGIVQPTGGGISVFPSPQLCGPTSSIFALQTAAPLPDGLTLVQDLDSHCLLAPSREMPFADYKHALAQLNSSATAVSGNAEAAFALAPRSRSPKTALRFVYKALVAVWRERVAIDGWDENDYAYVALLARDLDGGQLTLDDLRWTPESPGWTRRGAFTAQALRAFMAWSDAKAVGDETLEMDAGNDNYYLESILRLDRARYPDNPYAVVSM